MIEGLLRLTLVDRVQCWILHFMALDVFVRDRVRNVLRGKADLSIET